MEISPRYEGPAIIQLSGNPALIARPFVRQRERLLRVLADLTEEQWLAASRCEGWTVQDVATHLVTVDGFWALAISAGLAGEPSRFLVGFDPKATPDQLVDAARGVSPAETLAAITAATGGLLELVGGLEGDAFAVTAEAPPGHVTVSALLHHALWDAWVHERDILEPLGLEQEDHSDEIVASLRYAAALSPAFALANRTAKDGAMVLDLVDRSARIVVEVGDDVVSVHDEVAPAGALLLVGDAVDLLEALSVRRPIAQDVPPEHAWLLAGLTDVFETTA